jgi:large subunit ribosomal protein L6
MMMKTTHKINVHPAVQTKLNNNMLSFQGPLGCVKVDLALFDPTSQLAVQLTQSPTNILHIFASRTNKKVKSVVRLFQTCMEGVTQGFMVQLEAVGVGYKMSVSETHVFFRVGLSHTVSCLLPSDVKVIVPKPTQLIVFGIDKQRVTQVVSQLRAIKPPEPYKGKGLKRVSEFVFRKEGKKK